MKDGGWRGSGRRVQRGRWNGQKADGKKHWRRQQSQAERKSRSQREGGGWEIALIVPGGSEVTEKKTRQFRRSQLGKSRQADGRSQSVQERRRQDAYNGLVSGIFPDGVVVVVVVVVREGRRDRRYIDRPDGSGGLDSDDVDTDWGKRLQTQTRCPPKTPLRRGHKWYQSFFMTN